MPARNRQPNDRIGSFSCPEHVPPLQIMRSYRGMPEDNAEEQELYKGTLVHTDEFATLWYHAQFKMVHHQLHQIPESSAFRELLLRGAALVEEFGADRWLSDDRNNTVVREPDTEWAWREWAPRVTRAGFKYWGIVLPLAAVGKLNMRRIAQEGQQKGIIVQVSDQPEVIFDWLKQQAD